MCAIDSASETNQTSEKNKRQLFVLHPGRYGKLVGSSPRKPVLSEWFTKAFVAFVFDGALPSNRVALEANLYIVRRR